MIFPDRRPPLNLPLDHPGLRLLQRLRDEAHRFANTYNADLQSKKIRESILDEVPGWARCAARRYWRPSGASTGFARLRLRR